MKRDRTILDLGTRALCTGQKVRDYTWRNTAWVSHLKHLNHATGLIMQSNLDLYEVYKWDRGSRLYSGMDELRGTLFLSIFGGEKFRWQEHIFNSICIVKYRWKLSISFLKLSNNRKGFIVLRITSGPVQAFNLIYITNVQRKIFSVILRIVNIRRMKFR